MRVLWFANIIMPDVAKALGIQNAVSGGWQVALLRSLRKYFPDIKFMILAMHNIHRHIVVDGVQYVTFGKLGKCVYSDPIPGDIEKDVLNIISEFNPDVIHIHGTEYIFSRIKKDTLLNKPVLVSIQGVINGLKQYYNGNISMNELAPYRTLRNVLFRDGVFENHYRWQTKLSQLEEEALSCHQHYAGRTVWDKSWLAVYNPNATYHKLNEIMRPEFYSIKRNHNKIRKHSIYCSAAANYPLKGLHWLLRAVAILKSKYPDIEIRIANAQRAIMPPSGLLSWIKDRDYPAYLRHLVQELGLNNSIVCLPALSAIEVATELQRAHLFCLPSLCENSPNSLGEAMLIGTPCVAVYAGGIPSIIKHGKDGLLCTGADPIDLSNAIERIFSDNKQAEMYAANAKITAFKRHNPRQVAHATYKIYDMLRSG